MGEGTVQYWCFIKICPVRFIPTEQLKLKRSVVVNEFLSRFLVLFVLLQIKFRSNANAVKL